MVALRKIIFRNWKYSGKGNNNEKEIFIDPDNDNGSDNPKKSFKGAMKNFKRKSILMLIIGILVSYYFLLVPLNPRSISFWSYVVVILGILTVIFFVDSFTNNKSKKIYKFFVKFIVIIIGVIFIANIYSSPIFQSKRYAKLLEKETSDFKTDIEKADFSTIPVVDRDTARKLGSRKMGEMGELVSQYTIDETYSQICVDGKPERVTPLVYANFIKWLLNQKNGIPYYIDVNMVSQNVSLVKLKSPIKYSMSDKFGRNLYRHIRFKYPSAMIYDINFETDDDRNPYFVATCVEPKIGLFNGLDTKYIVVVNASTGEMAKYNVNEVPEWVDRVYPADIIVNQLTYNGMYKKGFINSKFKQEGVTKPTEGYNYISMGNDIYMYTGITSVLSDESNIGFVFINMRTKETKFYPVSSADEFSAMRSAEGAVQEKGYISTFPILINLYNRPTYFMSLKDEAKLTKMFALVDAQSYQKVAVGENLKETISNYKKISKNIGFTGEEDNAMTITVEDIKSAVIDSNTIYFIKAKDIDKLFTVSIEISPKFAFVKPMDNLSVTVDETDESYTITNLDKID